MTAKTTLRAAYPTIALGVLIVGVASSSLSASAQSVDLGLGRRLGDPIHSTPDPGEPVEEEPEAPWAGPQIQIGYGYWKLADGYGGGDTHVASFEVFVGWPIPQLRTSFLAEIGGRDFSIGGDDLVVRGAIAVGFQLTDLLEPFVPHISVLGTGGAVVGERFETTVAYGMGGAGIELGAELRVVRNLHIATAFSYLRLEMDGAAFDVFMFRASVGL